MVTNERKLTANDTKTRVFCKKEFCKKNTVIVLRIVMIREPTKGNVSPNEVVSCSSPSGSP